MIRNKLITIIFLLIFFCGRSDIIEASAIQPIKKVSLKKEDDKYHFLVEFVKNAEFSPRIHTLPTGAKILLSFQSDVTPPSTKKINHGIINGYFFEKFGKSSLMLFLSLKENVVFTEKRYTDNSIKLTFKITKKQVIAIDAGHGGRDFGAKCLSGDYEKNINLIMAIELRNLLIDSGRYKVVFTRSKDVFVPIDTRRNQIETVKPDLLISLHTDSNNDKNIRGISLYTLPNLDYLKQTSDDYYSNINQEEYYKILSFSRKFSNILTRYIPNKCKMQNKTCRNSELKILKVHTPAVLIELGCVSNKIDNKLLHFKDFRDKTNRAILYAIDQFFKENKVD